MGPRPARHLSRIRTLSQFKIRGGGDSVRIQKDYLPILPLGQTSKTLVLVHKPEIQLYRSAAAALALTRLLFKGKVHFPNNESDVVPAGVSGRPETQKKC